MVLVRPDGTGSFGFCAECLLEDDERVYYSNLEPSSVQDKLVDAAIALKHAIDNDDDPAEYIRRVDHYSSVISSEHYARELTETETQNKETEQ